MTSLLRPSSPPVIVRLLYLSPGFTIFDLLQSIQTAWWQGRPEDNGTCEYVLRLDVHYLHWPGNRLFKLFVLHFGSIHVTSMLWYKISIWCGYILPLYPASSPCRKVFCMMGRSLGTRLVTYLDLDEWYPWRSRDVSKHRTGRE